MLKTVLPGSLLTPAWVMHRASPRNHATKLMGDARCITHFQPNSSWGDARCITQALSPTRVVTQLQVWPSDEPSKETL